MGRQLAAAGEGRTAGAVGALGAGAGRMWQLADI